KLADYNNATGKYRQGIKQPVKQRNLFHPQKMAGKDQHKQHHPTQKNQNAVVIPPGRFGPQKLEIQPLQAGQETTHTAHIQNVVQVVSLAHRQVHEQVVQHHNNHDAVIKTHTQNL